MADTNTPLTDEEREELEALRAEKVRREEEERAAAERAELEALRAEQEKVDAEILAERAAEEARAAAQRKADADVAQHAPSPAPAPKSAPQPDSFSTKAPAEKSFGERMVTSDTLDSDGIPTMPLAQKIIIGICLVAAIGFVVYQFI